MTTMIKRLALVCALAVLALAFPARADDTDTLAHFHGSVKMSSPYGITTGAFFSEDLTSPGYRNRWHILVRPGDGFVIMPFINGNTYTVCVQVGTDYNRMFVAMPELLFRIDMTVSYWQLASQIEEISSRPVHSETRWQYVSFHSYPDETVQILMEEPIGTVNTCVPH